MARFSIGLFAIGLLVALARAETEVTEAPETAAAEAKAETPTAGPAEIAYQFLKKLFSLPKYRGSCIAKSMDHCGYDISKPKDLYNCYKKYYAANQDSCLKKKKPE